MQFKCICFLFHASFPSAGFIGHCETGLRSFSPCPVTPPFPVLRFHWWWKNWWTESLTPFQQHEQKQATGQREVELKERLSCLCLFVFLFLFFSGRFTLCGGHLQRPSERKALLQLHHWGEWASISQHVLDCCLQDAERYHRRCCWQRALISFLLPWCSRPAWGFIRRVHHTD